MDRDDVKNDYLIWDNPEAVSLVSVRRSGNVTTPVAVAKRRQLRFREIVGSGGVYTSRDLVWLLPVEELGGAVPKAADKVTDPQGNNWTILDAELNTWQTWYKATARNITLAADLRDVISHRRPVNEQDAAGGRVSRWGVVLPGVPARVQETGGSVQDKAGKRQAVKTYSIFVGDRLYPEAQDRIVAGDGRIFQITGWTTPDRIDVLQEIQAEIVT